jgi:chloramphenicol 3-O phosphotransferase
MRDKETEKLATGRVVLFNGPPSSGKTSLVTSIQGIVDEPWFHMSLDDFHSGYSEQWWLNDDGRIFGQLVAGYLASLREMARAGNDVLAEAVITPSRRKLYESTFGATPVVLVGVRCPLKVAVHRERHRADRHHGPIDLQSDSFAAVHSGLTYDFEIDTSRLGPRELAASMVPKLRGLTPTPFSSHLRP